MDNLPDSALNFPPVEPPSELIAEHQKLCTQLSQCSSVIIQNLRKCTSENDINDYLKKSGLKYLIRSWKRVSAKKLLLQFRKPQHACTYYYEKNFLDQILERPINAYLNVALDKKYIHKYYLTGLLPYTLRAAFGILKKVSICRINVKYERGEDQSTAIVSLVSVSEISQENLNYMCFLLASLKIRIYIWNDIHCPLKYSITVMNFLIGQQKCNEKQALAVAWNLVSALSLNYDTYPTIEVFSSDTEYETEFEADPTNIYAIMTCGTDSKTLNLFRRLKTFMAFNEYQAKIWLNTNEIPHNTYATLFTKNVINKYDLNFKRLEELIVQTFLEINQGLLYVEIFQTKKTDKFNVKLYFDSDESGRYFLANYPNYLNQLSDLYADKEKIEFEMFIDKEILKEFYEKQFEEERLTKEQERKEQMQEMFKRQQIQMMNYNMLSIMPPMGQFPPMMGQQMAYIPQRGNNPSMLRPSRYEN